MHFGLSSMSNKTIAKFSVFVIFTGFAAGFFTSCTSASPGVNTTGRETQYGPPKVIGTIKSADITESSGIAASRCQANVLWTHNDSGDDAFIFAIDGSGKSVGTWKLPNARNIDWEDIAAYKDMTGKCFLYIGEIGDNKTKRHDHAVYRVQEPVVTAGDAGSNRKAPLITANAEIIRFSYPDYDQDAETIMVHPKTGDIYVVTKRVSGPAGVYRIKPEFDRGGIQKVTYVAEIAVPAVPNGFLTGGDISPDGRRVVICDYSRAYEFVLPEDIENFEDIWAQTPAPIELGKRKGGESVCYSAHGTSIFATSESVRSPVIEVKRLD